MKGLEREVVRTPPIPAKESLVTTGNASTINHPVILKARPSRADGPLHLPGASQKRFMIPA